MRRRDFLSASSLVMGISSAGFGSAGSPPAIRSILDYGARPEGTSLNTQAIQRAIDQVHSAGGGTVYVPAGTFLTGGLELKSRVTLYLEAGAVLLGSRSIDDHVYHQGPVAHSDANDYLLIFAQNDEDVTICGPGTIDGQGEAYWEPVNWSYKHDDMWKDVASGHYAANDKNQRPLPMIEFAQCRNVSVIGVTLKNSAGWTLRPIACDMVVIDGVCIRNPCHGRDTDGFDVREAFVTGIRVPRSCHVFTQLDGAMSADIRLPGNSLVEGQRAVNCVDGAVEGMIKVDVREEETGPGKKHA